MGRSDNNGMIDGYMAVQSVRRNSGKQHERVRSDLPDTSAPPQPDATGTTPVSKPLPFGHTALPTRHEIHCYACGYKFVHTGKLDRVLCPKCKEQLHTGDKTICGTYTGTIQTVGTVTIFSGAVVTDSRITASVIRIAGACRKTTLTPGIRVELETGAVIETARLDTVDVVIHADQQVALDTELCCKTLQLRGSLRAAVRAREKAEIKTGARFQGQLHAPSLVVEEGAALRAELFIKPISDQNTGAAA
ncbi:MAG: polymer-forming cytoskeletal protein [Kiritimatiellia bacterium]